MLMVLATLSVGCARRNRAASNASSAVDNRKPEEIRRENARDLASVMADELQLRDDQVLRVRQVLANTVEQVNAAQKKFGDDKAGLTTALKQINAASESQLKSAMTSAQYKLYQQRKPQIQQKLREQQQQK
ncbi:hypothetical protein GCM10023186_43830 [Hymenobacter koreensis]|uniref:Periplasmic heavy metal sensor n=2 Tax=Hymenobacter koreensis TaxID=1084523 RepID=A0ABP8JLT6_9BACT